MLAGSWQKDFTKKKGFLVDTFGHLGIFSGASLVVICEVSSALGNIGVAGKGVLVVA